LITDDDLRSRLADRGRVTAQGRGIEARADIVADLYRHAARRSSDRAPLRDGAP
jgi:hypothetical protein